MANIVTRAQLGAQIMRLPSEQRDRAIRHLRLLQDAREKKGAVAHAKRDHVERRRYAEDPWAYVRDIFGLSLSQQQDDVLHLLLRELRLLIPSANNVGKTFELALWGLFRFDVTASLEAEGDSEQGARILLPGPDHDTIYATIYSEMLTLARRAELRGHLMPGERSDISVLWRVRPKWEMEAFSPPKKVGAAVAHTASGRHHRNQVALIEEGQGVPEQVWKGAEGMCSSDGNQIVSSFNPTESTGPAYQRAMNGTYAVIHLSAFDHPNVRQRKPVIPAAVSLAVVENRIRSDCRDRGPHPGTPIDPEYKDFAYALPPDSKAEELGPRHDGLLGHQLGEPRVYRPNGAFTGQVLGQWPADSERGLVSAGDWDAGVNRWKRAQDPNDAPDRVGADLAREGHDETVTAPAWGSTAAALLRLYADAQTADATKRKVPSIEELRANHRVRIGTLHVFPKGDGVDTAVAIAAEYPDSPFTMDESGVGSSPFDHITRVLGRDAVGVSFSAVPHEPLPGEPWSENLRTQLYVRAAMLCARGLIDPPDDPILREEILAHQLEHTRKTITKIHRDGRREKIRVDAVVLVSKDTVKSLIGRSPDRSDAFVLSVYDAPPKKMRRSWVPPSDSYVNV